MTGAPRKPLEFESLSDEEITRRAAAFAETARRRRSVRHFQARPVSREALESIIATAASGPSGANQQPWHFAVITAPELKRRIREAAEIEERAFYEDRAPDEWIEALEPFETDADKAFLEDAAALVVVLVERWGEYPGGQRKKHYYPRESVGIATGMLITAAHFSGLATLTYTPSPMKFLTDLLGRGDNEVPFMVVAIGHPQKGATVPDIAKKSLDEVATFL